MKMFFISYHKILESITLIVEKELRKARSEWTGTQEALSDAG